jgi:hypothetical protein
MTDDVPVSRADGPGEHRTAQGADGAGVAATRQVDRASLGAAFPRGGLRPAGREALHRQGAPVPGHRPGQGRPPGTADPDAQRSG